MILGAFFWSCWYFWLLFEDEIDNCSFNPDGTVDNWLCLLILSKNKNTNESGKKVEECLSHYIIIFSW